MVRMSMDAAVGRLFADPSSCSLSWYKAFMSVWGMLFSSYIVGKKYPKSPKLTDWKKKTKLGFVIDEKSSTDVSLRKASA